MRGRQVDRNPSDDETERVSETESIRDGGEETETTKG